MITQNNLKSVLQKLGFVKNGNVFIRNFGDCQLKVDFARQQLIYPEAQGLKINERQTCNFSANENFVVFECVCRLLEKGYNPKHIELEPKWKLGHGASGGRADIWIKDNNDDSLLIIECKTAGKEFDDAWKDTLEDGGQLFGYFQQEKSTQFLALYASDFVDDKIVCDYKLIAVRDNEEHLKSFGKKKVLSFKNADKAKNLFKAWAETYRKEFFTRGLFENDISKYFIGKSKYTIDDLKDVDSESIQKKYHEFATILRQHNVSGHENAFDKLVNLFLAKIVDETTNKDELAFYWKGTAYDDVKSLIDRLQKHYKIGMEKFLHEDVTYVEKAEIEKAFRLFRNKPDATKDAILGYFDKLKYYTNNDFAFIDVHNEKLFYQNAEVLLKIVQMLQDIKLQTDIQNQFLGDLFEGFLDKGVKQSEGQFFTPTPIVKFLISCLPLEKLICESEDIPRVIDYACGAGHFLNEYANQIFPIVKKSYVDNGVEINLYDPSKIKSHYSRIIGIEKEYRLSKVAKVSAFMYGQDEINIIYADALAKNKDIKDGTFSVLVANPPYSVKGFLETLDDDSLTRFELFESIDDKQKKTNNSIECFFVERAKQLLKSGGVAAIILPSSILSNSSNIYTQTREVLLKHFNIVAIAEFGSGTFGKTGTNTVTLFLERKNDNLALADHYRNRVDCWFDGDFEVDKIFKDTILLQRYCDKIQIAIDDYKTLLNKAPNEKLLAADIFKEYKKAFENSPEYKNIQKKKITIKYTESNKTIEMQNAHLSYLQTIEKDKLYFFMLAESQRCPVVIVKSPTENKAMKSFLGYEWSSAKGNEGIKYLGANVSDEEDAISKNKGIDQIKTPLFNPVDLHDKTKINSIVRANFNDETLAENEFVSVAKLTDMIDFSRVVFDKAIKTTSEKRIEIISKFPLKTIEEIANSIESGSRPKGGVGNFTEGVYSLGGEHIDNTSGYLNLESPKFVSTNFYNNATKGKIKKNDLLICKDGALTGKLAFVRDELDGVDAMVNEHVFILRCENIITQKYLFIFLYSENGQTLLKRNITGAAQGGLNSTNLKNIKVPLPPIDIQKKIVSECEKIDKEYNTSRMTIESYKQKIAKIFNELEVIAMPNNSGGGGGKNV